MDTPHYQSRDDLHTTTQNLADEPTLAEHNGKGLKALAFTISEILHCIVLRNICFSLASWLSFVPRAPEISTSMFSWVLNTMAKVCKLKHSPLLWYSTAVSKNMWQLTNWFSFVPRAPEISTSMFSGVLNTMVGNQAEMTLHTTTQNLADKPTLANWPPTLPEQRWLAYHYTKLGRWTYFGWTQRQRFESSSIHHFWDTPQHFLKTNFCLESGFLLFLELQKSLLVSVQGCWTQWQRFESSSIYHLWHSPQHFLKTHVCLESGFLSSLQLQKSSTSKFLGVLITMAKVWKL